MFRFLKRFFCVHEYSVIHEMETTRTYADAITVKTGGNFSMESMNISEDGLIKFLGKKKLVILSCKHCGKTITERLD